MPTTRIAVLLAGLVALVPLATAQVSPPGGDVAAQRTILGSAPWITVALGLVLLVVAIGLLVTGLRRGPRAVDRVAGAPGGPAARERTPAGDEERQRRVS
jgi:protein-S-isoprenylcysteine O-methyltransferase Ste14